MDSFDGLFKRILNCVRNSPEREMMIIDEERVTYNDFFILCNQLSEALLAEDIVPGDKIALLLPNNKYWYSIFWAISRIGAIPVPFDPQLGVWEMEKLFQITEIKICFAVCSFRGVNHFRNLQAFADTHDNLKKVVFLEEIEPNSNFVSLEYFLKRYEDEVEFSEQFSPSYKNNFMLACTSGTTGDPKILVVQQGGFYQAENDMADFLKLNNNDVMLIGMPLYHQGGFGMGLQGAIMGSRIIYQSKFDPYKILKIIEQEHVSLIQLTSTLAKILLSVPDFNKYDLSSLKLAYFAGEVLPNDIARKFYDELGVRVINIIGSSETATMLVWDSAKDSLYDCNSYKTLNFTDVKIINEKGDETEVGEIGMIHIHTDAIITEYYKNSKETQTKIYSQNNKFWFITGDLGRKSKNGRILFAGRKKRVIKKGANLVHPEEIESFLLTHPEIEAAALTAKKNELMGDSLVAYIQITKKSDLNKLLLRKYCRGKLSSYKIPDEFYFVSSIPKDIGKIQYKYLKKLEREK